MNKYLKHSSVIGCAVLVFLVRQPYVLGQSSTNYSIQKDVMDQGGSVSSSENYQVIDAVGQPEPIGTSASQGYIESSGFFTGGGVSTGIVEEAALTIPTEFQLCQNFPNPFNPSTSIIYRLEKRMSVLLEVYNILGQKVETLIDGSQEAGEHQVRWAGRSVPSGVYLCRMKAGKFTETRKMLLLR